MQESRPESRPRPEAAAADGDPGLHGAAAARERMRLDMPNGAAPTREEFRRVSGRFATGIAVVTTTVRGEGEACEDHAMTVNAFTSVSLDPLLVLFCAEKIARFHDAVLASGRWAVSVLGEDAREAARWFATRGRPLEGQLDEWPHHRGQHSGAVIFSNAIAAIECRTWAVHDGGDHSIVVGEVLGVSTPDPGGRPLLYYEGAYGALAGEHNPRR